MPVDPDDAFEAGVGVPTAESSAVKAGALCVALALLTYIATRLWDMAASYQVSDHKPGTGCASYLNALN